MSLSEDLLTLHAPVRLGQVITDWDSVLRVINEAHRLEAENAKLKVELGRAAMISSHLMDMIDPQTWRDEGAIGPEGQYEGDYRASLIMQEIRDWKQDDPYNRPRPEPDGKRNTEGHW